MHKGDGERSLALSPSRSLAHRHSTQQEESGTHVDQLEVRQHAWVGLHDRLQQRRWKVHRLRQTKGSRTAVSSHGLGGRERRQYARTQEEQLQSGNRKQPQAHWGGSS